MEEVTPLIDPKLLEMLICPQTGEKLVIDKDKLIGKGVSYPIKNGVPILLYNPHYMSMSINDGSL